MKKFLLFGAVIGLSSCEFYYLEPVYDPRTSLLGRYEVEEYSETYNDMTYYSIWIERSSSGSNQIWIKNFYAVNIRVYSTLSYDKITIPRQVVDGYEVEGTGTVYGDQISFHYRLRDLYSNSATDFLEASAWKDY